VVTALFGKVNMQWNSDSFPFTDPSFELEVAYKNRKGDWLEVLGCGVIHKDVLKNGNFGGHVGWAFGIGLERLAMPLFDIPDIRLFWSRDKRFLNQFKDGQMTKFKPFSKFPPCFKDVTFIRKGDFHENDFAALVRETAGDLVEQLTLLSTFTHPKTSETSHCYRVSYRSLERNLTNEEVDVIQNKVIASLTAGLPLTIK